MSYRIRLEVYEGPLDLLLHLIRKEELNICDISISRVAEQYVEYINLMRVLDLDIAGEFLVMASTLMHIKSRMLLPDEEFPEEEEEDPRENLMQQLLEYNRYKEAAYDLERRELIQQNVFTRPGREKEEEILLEVSLFDLIGALTGVLERFKEEPLKEIIREEVTVKERIRFIMDMLTVEKKVNFTQLFTTSRSRVEAIVTFLALLELIRLREVRAIQKESFGEVYLHKHREGRRIKVEVS